MLDESGAVLMRQKLSTTPRAMREAYGAMPRGRIALKTGMRSPWVRRFLSELEKAQADLSVILARAGLVRARTALVNTARGLAKSSGERLRGCNVPNMNPEKAKGLSPDLQRPVQPLLGRIESLSESIADSNERIEQLTQQTICRWRC